MFTFNLQQMSREEKIATMEAIWTDLSRDPETFDSPAWHANALADAESSVRDGTAQFRPLSEVKQRINQAVS